MWDFEDIGDWWTRADPAGIAPIVAVPTTAGTGSEVGRAGVITNLATHTKKMIFHPRMMPAQVICDPELTVGLPPALTAGTGMDALRPLPRGLLPARPITRWPRASRSRACGSCKEFLPRAYRDGARPRGARRTCWRAAAMGATAFQKGLGAIHALSHPVGALYDTHHGLTNAVFMPYVLDFNREAIEDKIDRLAGWLGIEGGFAGFLDFVLACAATSASRTRSTGSASTTSRFAEMAEMAVVDPTAGGNPRPLAAADALELYQRAIDGRLGDIPQQSASDALHLLLTRDGQDVVHRSHGKRKRAMAKFSAAPRRAAIAIKLYG